MRSVAMCPRAKWVVLWSLWAARLVRQPTAPVRVSGGLLRGGVANDGSHAHYLAIPYATLGAEDRFKSPGPEPTWEGVFEAVNEHIRCPQRTGETSVIGQEDCLTLNVYTPLDAAYKAPLPVMVFIHGGGFFEGSGSRFFYGPEYLVTKDVVLVTINYRLNIQGYLCLGIKEAPGNAGLKDQVAALKWIKKNIKVFGGDPNSVTLFGESAGSVSVSFHVLSPMSKGLFHKAILQSGSSLAAWGYQYRPVYMASLLAKVMGYDTQDPNELYNIFMNKTDAELIVTRVPRKEGNLIISELLYVPCTEQVIDGVEPFLTDVPYDVLSKGDYNKVPMIIGITNQEGFLFAALENDTMISRINFEQSLPKDLVIPKEQRGEIAEEFRKLYMGDEDISRESLLKLSRLHAEPYFNYPFAVETDLILKTSDRPVYNYLFSYNGWRNFPKLLAGEPFRSAPGATHADDLFYVFKQLTIPSLLEYKMIDRMSTMWTNFAKFGDPTPESSELLPVKWYPTNRTSFSSLVIDTEFTTSPIWNTESLKLWHQVYTKYRRKQ